MSMSKEINNIFGKIFQQLPQKVNRQFSVEYIQQSNYLRLMFK